MSRCAECIISDVSHTFQVSRARLRQPVTGGWVDLDATKARQAAYYILKGERGLSYEQIARIMHREWSTVRDGVKRARERLAADPDFAAQFERVRG